MPVVSVDNSNAISALHFPVELVLLYLGLWSDGPPFPHLANGPDRFPEPAGLPRAWPQALPEAGRGPEVCFPCFPKVLLRFT